MKIIENFPVNTGTICLMSQLNDILSYHGYHLNESCLLGLCEGYQFYYGGLNDRHNKDTRALLKLGGMKFDIPQMIHRLKECLGIAVIEYVPEEDTHTREFIRTYVGMEKPLLAFVMANELEYSASYKKDAHSHAIGIYGYDFEKDLIWVTDTYVNTKPVSSYRGELTFSHLTRGFDLSEALFEMQSRERMYALYPVCQQDFHIIPLEELNGTLIRAASDNLNGISYKGGIVGGIESMLLLEQDYETWHRDFDSNTQVYLMKALHNQITNFGGPAVTNKMMADYVKYIYDREKKPMYLSFQQQFYRLYCLWQIAGNLCYKNALKGTDTEGKVMIYFAEIRRLSKQLYEDILDKTGGK